MTADLELQIDLGAKILGKTREQFIEEACRLLCRSVASGGMMCIVGRRGKAKAIDAAAAKRAKDSPGSMEGRIMAFVTKHGTVRPKDIAAHLSCDLATSRRRVKALCQAGALKATGTTAGRKIGLP